MFAEAFAAASRHASPRSLLIPDMIAHRARLRAGARPGTMRRMKSRTLLASCSLTLLFSLAARADRRDDALAAAARALDETTQALGSAAPSAALEKALQQLAVARERLAEARFGPKAPPGALAKLAGVGVMERIAGMWTGPLQSETSAGNFPLMNLDFRAVGAGAVFARSDLDADNGIRMLFAVERHEGADRLVFRSRGLFFGFVRDTRAALEEESAGEGRWRFCSMKGGCAHV